jgi:site-specific recombinase XerD
MILKKCKDCGKQAPANTVHFPIRRTGRNGLAARCRECQAKMDREIYEKKCQNRAPKQPKPARKPAETRLEKEIEAFLEAHKNLSFHTVRGYRLALDDYARDFPDFPPTAQNVTDWLSRKIVTKATRFTFYGRMRAFCQWLHKTERVTRYPLIAIVRPPRAENLPRSPREADLKKLITLLENRLEFILEEDPKLKITRNAYKDIRSLALYSLMLDTGLRISEVQNLELSDVDLEEMSLLVRQTKNGKERYVMFGKKVKGNLKLWLQTRQGLGLDEGLQFLFVCRRERWAGMSRTPIVVTLARLCQEAGIKKISPHQLRHAHASQSIKNGQNPERLRQQLGHSSIQMTARYFMLPNEGRQKDHLASSPLDNLGRAA